MARKTRFRAACVAILCGGVPLVTTANCDPRTGQFDFFRDDDNEFFDDEFHDDSFHEDEFFFDGGFFDDCFFDCY